ncbi:MAG TPA: hypothetical protein VFE91_01305, partial [Nitrososphaerales archaeon]|nr:hypothetical protein [Nitrososphaerales archaeon]
LEGADSTAIRAKNDALKNVLQEVGASVYQQSQKQQSAPQGGPGGPQDATNVSDADYKVVDEGK